jgi:glycosyltransferase involved in cell wall biosynthesis
MYILYIHQHFATPKGSTGTRSYQFAERWIKAGYKVTIITGRYDIGGLNASKGLIKRLSIDGINVIVTGIGYSNKQSFVVRCFSFLFFIIFSTIAGLFEKNIDIIYATSTPLTVGIPAIIIKWLKRTPFVFEVRDQWPEIPIQMGILKNKFLKKFLLGLEKFIYSQSVAVVALSPGMAEGIKKITGQQKPIHIIPNCCDTDVFTPDIDAHDLRSRYNWSDKLVLLHFGAMGRANGLDFVVNIAQRLQQVSDIRFVLIGDGSEKPALIEKISKLNLKNIEILDSVPKNQLVCFIAACNVSMVIFANYPILQDNSANKFFDSLSAGKPVLLNYSGWQRELLEKNIAGLGCKQCDKDEFIERVLYLNSNRHLLPQMGKNARTLAEQEFDRPKLAARLENILLEVVERS